MRGRVVIKRSGYDPRNPTRDPSLDASPGTRRLKGATFARAEAPRPMALSPTQRRLLERAAAAPGGRFETYAAGWLTARSLARRGLGTYRAPCWGMHRGAFTINDAGRAELKR